MRRCLGRCAWRVRQALAWTERQPSRGTAGGPCHDLPQPGLSGMMRGAQAQAPPRPGPSGEMVDTGDLKSPDLRSCRFESGLGHQAMPCARARPRLRFSLRHPLRAIQAWQPWTKNDAVTRAALTPRPPVAYHPCSCCHCTKLVHAIIHKRNACDVPPGHPDTRRPDWSLNRCPPGPSHAVINAPDTISAITHGASTSLRRLIQAINFEEYFS